ncbi:MAG: SoxR reducing system RseC family protein, partial [Bacteroidales bacterium]|nr:SoxR reducing system RseC family protein [Bacteroidales bacterium]
MTANEISHQGTISRIEGKTAFVDIQVSSACGSCKAASFCGSSDSSSRCVEAAIPQNTDLSVGDEVKVVITRSMGTKAVVLGYGLPFVVVMIGLVAMISLGVGEGIAALASLLLLGFYYLA